MGISQSRAGVAGEAGPASGVLQKALPAIASMRTEACVIDAVRSTRIVSARMVTVTGNGGAF